MKTQNASSHKAQVIYFSHGGGPLPILGDAGHLAMVDFMVQLPSRIRKPEAVLVISAHWEEAVPTLLSAENPPLFYDYYGFPDAAYEITYPAPGNPELSHRIAELLTIHS
ncbi:MAG TPA: class III extradiol ring-cleavage dioxygenase, partial [Thermodesulfobacteriota bacterium]|nr:class III extradiol ring-cleavage dioxygenase [Thermodesulfobacteriota bacterium]